MPFPDKLLEVITAIITINLKVPQQLLQYQNEVSDLKKKKKPNHPPHKTPKTPKQMMAPHVWSHTATYWLPPLYPQQR